MSTCQTRWLQRELAQFGVVTLALQFLAARRVGWSRHPDPAETLYLQCGRKPPGVASSSGCREQTPSGAPGNSDLNKGRERARPRRCTSSVFTSGPMQPRPVRCDVESGWFARLRHAVDRNTPSAVIRVGLGAIARRQRAWRASDPHKSPLCWRLKRQFARPWLAVVAISAKLIKVARHEHRLSASSAHMRAADRDRNSEIASSI